MNQDIWDIHLDEFDRDYVVTFFQLVQNKEKYGALKYSKWNDDIQVMMAAVQQNWRALEFASNRLKIDPEHEITGHCSSYP